MTTARIITLYLLIFFVTGYGFFGLIDILNPWEQHFDTLTWSKYWKISDGYMGKRMPIYAQIWVVLSLINLVLFYKTRKISPIFWMVLVTLLIFVGDIAFTIKNQMPLNQMIQSMDLNQVTPEKMQKLEIMRTKDVENFGTRRIAGWVMFFIMSITPYLLPRLNPKTV
jgi:hypothetical protein